MLRYYWVNHPYNKGINLQDSIWQLLNKASYENIPRYLLQNINDTAHFLIDSKLMFKYQGLPVSHYICKGIQFMISSIDLKCPQQLIMPTAKHSILVKGFCTKISSHNHISSWRFSICKCLWCYLCSWLGGF